MSTHNLSKENLEKWPEITIYLAAWHIFLKQKNLPTGQEELIVKGLEFIRKKIRPYFKARDSTTYSKTKTLQPIHKYLYDKFCNEKYTDGPGEPRQDRMHLCKAILEKILGKKGINDDQLGSVGFEVLNGMVKTDNEREVLFNRVFKLSRSGEVRTPTSEVTNGIQNYSIDIISGESAKLAKKPNYYIDKRTTPLISWAQSKKINRTPMVKKVITRNLLWAGYFIEDLLEELEHVVNNSTDSDGSSEHKISDKSTVFKKDTLDKKQSLLDVYLPRRKCKISELQIQFLMPTKHSDDGITQIRDRVKKYKIFEDIILDIVRIRTMDNHNFFKGKDIYFYLPFFNDIVFLEGRKEKVEHGQKEKENNRQQVVLYTVSEVPATKDQMIEVEEFAYDCLFPHSDDYMRWFVKWFNFYWDEAGDDINYLQYI